MVQPVFDDLSHLHHLSSMAAPVHQHILAQATTWIADSAADAANPDDGWWESYIQIYKNGLAFVHDNIVDEPLRKMGFTQTWGVSIFLFTAGECDE
jgi:hypothetical protein